MLVNVAPIFFCFTRLCQEQVRLPSLAIQLIPTIATRQAVVKLQGDPEARRAWQLLCEQSRREFQVIYDLLDIQLTERGESFYNLFLPAVIEDLNQSGLLVEDGGAQCVFLQGLVTKRGNHNL